MKNYDHRFYEKRFPDIGEVVIVKITKCTEIGVYVELVEYNNIEGLIMLGELSKKKIKSLGTYVKPNTIDAAIVIRVDEEKGYIDVSKRKIGQREFEESFMRYTRNKIAHNVMIMVARTLERPIDDLYSEYFLKAKPYGSIHNFFLKINNNEIDDPISEFVKRKFNVTKYKVRADVDVSSYKGVDDVVNALKVAKSVDDRIEVFLQRMPIYNVCIMVTDKDEGMRKINDACDRIKDEIEKRGGTFRMNSEPTVYGEKGSLDYLCTKFEDLCEESIEEELKNISEA